MNLNVLKYVIMVAEEKNMTKAAERLYISQPSLSQSIQSLEKELKVNIFDRSHSPIKLTYAGEQFVEWARQTLHTKNELMQKLSDISEDKQRCLVIGIAPNRSILMLTDVLKTFYLEVSGCSIILEERPVNELTAMLENETIDLLIDFPNSDTMQFTNIHIADEKILLAAPKSYVFNTNPGEDIYPLVQLSEINNKPIVMLAQEQYIGKITRGLFSINNTHPKLIMECNHIETAHLMVSKGAGITFVPELSAKEDMYSNVSYYEIADTILTRSISVVYRRNHYLTSDAQKFISIMQENLSMAGNV